MRISRTAVLVLMIVGVAGCAGPQGGTVGVSASGEIQPGVYGRVELGNRPRPPLVYAEPLIVVPLSREAEPIYLHVPPGHAKRWSMYCHRYHACDQPVYFVKSKEYEVDEARPKKGMGDDDNRRYRGR